MMPKFMMEPTCGGDRGDQTERSACRHCNTWHRKTYEHIHRPHLHYCHALSLLPPLPSSSSSSTTTAVHHYHRCPPLSTTTTAVHHNHRCPPPPPPSLSSPPPSSLSRRQDTAQRTPCWTRK
ncbi:hypothetical protein Vafri_8558 [Volvox africanus]|nr:hypothetical protein Vafri_8558 [Volvox africanus]